MPITSTFLPTTAVDVVGVFDAQFNQVFSNARPMKAMVMEQAKAMEHPVETGVTITDHRIILPTEIELSVLLSNTTSNEEYRSLYQQIKQLWINATLLTVQTRTDSYANMLITGMPHDETADMFDAIAVGIKLKEALFVQARFGTLPPTSVKNKSNASTVDRGEQQTTTSTSTEDPSLLYGWVFGEGEKPQ
jgi:hypothetical protein